MSTAIAMVKLYSTGTRTIKIAENRQNSGDFFPEFPPEFRKIGGISPESLRLKLKLTKTQTFVCDAVLSLQGITVISDYTTSDGQSGIKESIMNDRDRSRAMSSSHGSAIHQSGSFKELYCINTPIENSFMLN
jgi:hypothetical protein